LAHGTRLDAVTASQWDLLGNSGRQRIAQALITNTIFMLARGLINPDQYPMHSIMNFTSRTPATLIDLSRTRTIEEIRADCEANPDLTSLGQTCCLSRVLRPRIVNMFSNNFRDLPDQIRGHFTSALMTHVKRIKSLNPDILRVIRHFCAEELCKMLPHRQRVLEGCTVGGEDTWCLSAIFGEGNRGKGGGEEGREGNLTEASDEACFDDRNRPSWFLKNGTYRFSSR